MHGLLARIGAAIMVAAVVAGSGCVSAGEPTPVTRLDVPLGAWRGDGAAFMAALGDPSDSGVPSWPGPFDAPALFADLDGDGQAEIIGLSRDRTVRVYDASGQQLASLGLRLPPSWHVDQWLNGIAVGTLSVGGPRVIVAGTPAAGVFAYAFDGRDGDGFAFDLLWERRLDECFARPGMDATPVLFDADGDGADEVYAQIEQVGLFGLASDGRTMWTQCWAGGNADAALADLDGDGDVEVVFASDSGFVSVLDAMTGKPQWTFDARAPAYGIAPASISVRPTIADLDGVAPLEILFTARHVPADDPAAFADYHMAIFAIHQDLKTWQPELVWMRQPDWAHPLSYTRLVVQDVDGDGEADIFGMDWNTVGHVPGDWEHLGDAHVFRLDASGRDVWVREVDSWWSNKDLAVGDFDGDGNVEVLANGAGPTGDGLRRLDAATGLAEGFLGVGPLKVAKGPTVGVLQAGGSIHLAMPAGPLEGRSFGTIMLYDLGVTWVGPIPEENL